MSAISRPIASSSVTQLRPFDVGRDLNAVADLVETCFAETLDSDGRRYVDQMHAAARNPRYLRWAAAMADHVSLPLTGFVWEENGRLVGNLSLIPFISLDRRYYLIANVAVDPQYRRRGIARSLTLAAIEHARRRGVHAAWLHARAENQSALNMYLALGFIERARRSSWESDQQVPMKPGPPGVTLTPRHNRQWPKQLAWLQRLYPPELTWHLPMNLHVLRPGFWGAVYRFFSTASVSQWAAIQGQQLLGVLAWQAQIGQADRLWLAASPETEDIAISALLPYARSYLSNRPRLVLDYPAGRGTQAFQEAGFHKQQTLIWMEVKFR
ncbi:MAG TPA: GNAT family N-acetyltransferase [Anaerolineales bacterium]|nr:GNAT family N-acetyltransferase [Anaerolineales bacterium]